MEETRLATQRRSDLSINKIVAGARGARRGSNGPRPPTRGLGPPAPLDRRLDDGVFGIVRKAYSRRIFDMGGHSHWANIKHKKGATDAKRGKAWTKLSREISIAAKLGGGGDPDSNPRLRAAIVDAAEAQRPSDTIARAIKRGIGDTEGATFEELTYEGYAAGGVAMLIDCTSDNRNRTRSEIHTVMAKNGGSLGAPNSVAWSFKTKGLIAVKKEGAPS